jgi:hypothetical protein
VITSAAFDRGRIESLLTELGRRCQAKGIDAELFIVGDAAMALAYSRDRVTRDLDAIFEPKAEVYSEVDAMANDLGLPPEWLNDGVKGVMPDRADRAPGVLFESDGLKVMIASAEYLLAMKAAAARQTRDTDDFLVLAAELGVTTSDQAFAIVDKYYDRQRLTPNSQFFIEQTFSTDRR